MMAKNPITPNDVVKSDSRKGVGVSLPALLSIAKITTEKRKVKTALKKFFPNTLSL